MAVTASPTDPAITNWNQSRFTSSSAGEAAPHRRHGMVDQEISQHRAAEGSADERCHHRISQGRAPLSQTESAKDSGHYQPDWPSRSAIFTA